jgi:hypothetical protein
MEIARSMFFFLLLAGLFCIREGRGLAFALLGAAILVLYGTIDKIIIMCWPRA